uniref:Angiotensin-converting enzyme n=1 Tax=Timema poppense TaxID=170557 RepID=A0A7R9H0A7_TIMPO|nr:unnamed protein product [Timema poppensis]
MVFYLTCSIYPGIESVISSSRDYDELTYAWKSWRDATGPKMREDYKKYVEINNIAAAENGFSDNGEMWRSSFESETFIADMDALWEQVRPLYDELHKYVRTKLRGVYGDKMDDSDGLLPAHILGNMWAQSWVNLFDIMQPYPEGTLVDVTAALIQQNYTVLRMFETSDAFYQSLGLPTNSMSYDETRAMLVRPEDGREVVCHASAWDFCDGADFRIKMCTQVNMEDFVTIHHEMGHIQYYIQYKDQPDTLRSGANPGFHEAIGDTIALSVATPQHLEKIGLLMNYEDTPENSINTLMQMALEKIAFLPFGLLIDKWRWDVFSGAVNETQWNDHWWYYRKEIQKVKPPVSRTAEDFDPGAKYHVPGDSQYISYFAAHILQFVLQCRVYVEGTLWSTSYSLFYKAVSMLKVLCGPHLTVCSTKPCLCSRYFAAHILQFVLQCRVYVAGTLRPTSYSLFYNAVSMLQVLCGLHLTVCSTKTCLCSRYFAAHILQFQFYKAVSMFQVLCGPHLTVSVLQSRVYVPGTLRPTSYSLFYKAVSMLQVLCGPHLTVCSTKTCLCSRYFVAHILQFQFYKAVSMFQVLCGPHLTVSVLQSRVYVPGTLRPTSYSFSSTKPCLCSRYFAAHILQFVLQRRVYVPGTLWPTSYSLFYKDVSMFQVLCGPHLTVCSTKTCLCSRYFAAHNLQFVLQRRVYVPGTLWPTSYSLFYKDVSMFQVLCGPQLTVCSTKTCLCSRYFVAHILQFQFHKALCIAAGQYDPTDPNTQPLHKCDIYNSTAAGQKLRYIFL